MKKSNIFIYSLIVSIFMVSLTGSIWLNNLERINAGDLRFTEWVIFAFLIIITVLLVIMTVFSSSYNIKK